MLSIVLIGISLSMDACAVSVSAGVTGQGLKKFYILRSALFFGLFQFIMPVIGYYLGKTFLVYIEAFDHWIAFVLLAGIGGKMLYESLSKKNGGRQGETAADIRSLKTLLVLAVATSIDALAVGISLTMIGRGIWLSASLIGGITFVICLLGFEFGKRIGAFFEKSAQITGGIILMAIGVKILAEHLL